MTRRSKYVHCLVDKDIHDRLADLKDKTDGVSKYEELFDKMSKVVRVANRIESSEDKENINLMLNILNEGD